MEQAIKAITFAKANATRNWSQAIFSGEMKFGPLSSWGCYSNNETIYLFFFTGALDCSKYLKILELVLPTTNNEPKENVSFIHDITDVNNSSMIREWFSKNHPGIEVLQSPVNIMENIRLQIKKELENTSSQNYIKFSTEELIRETWDHLMEDSKYVQSLIDNCSFEMSRLSFEK